MQLMGASAVCAGPVVHELAAAAFEGRVALVWLDGEDLTALFGDAGDNVADVLKQAAKVLPFES